MKSSYAAALRGPIDAQDGGTLVQRDSQVRALVREIEAAGRRGQRAVFRSAGRIVGRTLLHRPDRNLRRGQRVRAVAGRLAGAGGPRVLRRHRRQPGEHASAPPVPHPRATGGRFHRRGPRPARTRAATQAVASDAALLAAVNAPRGDGMRDIVATIQAEQDEIIRLDHPGRAGDRGRPRHRQDRGGAAPRRVPALHPAEADREPRRARGRAQLGVPEPHRPCSAVARRIRRGVHDDWGPRARPARHRRGHPGSRAPQGLADDAGRARRGDRRPATAAARIRCRSNWPTSRCESTPRPREWAIQEARASGRAAQRGPRSVHRDHHLRADRAGDRQDRPRLADPRGPRGLGAAARGPGRASSPTTPRSPPRSTNSGRS